MRRARVVVTLLAVGSLLANAAVLHAQSPFFFGTGAVDGRMAMGAQHGSSPSFEIQTADDFVLGAQTLIQSATFTGLMPLGLTAADITQLSVSIFRQFPLDASTPPSGNVPTRIGSPSDFALDTRAVGSGLTFSSAILASNFTATNSVSTGIHPLPGQLTGGDGSVSGQEVQFTLAFTTPFDLAADHYFFVPQVQLTSGIFYWLSAAYPVASPGTPFVGDQQAWIRNAGLAPDWLRVGTDIVGGAQPAVNAAFTLSGITGSMPGSTTPEPTSTLLLATGLALTGWRRRPRSSDATV